MILKPLYADGLAQTGNTTEEGTMGDTGKREPGFQRNVRAGGVSRATVDFYLTPAGFTTKTQHRSLVQTSTQPRPSSLCSRPTSRPVISERRRPPAKPISNIARSRKLLIGAKDCSGRKTGLMYVERLEKTSRT